SDDICEDPYYSTPATDVSPRSITLNGMHEENGYNKIQLRVPKRHKDKVVSNGEILDENYSHIRKHDDKGVYYSTPCDAPGENGDEPNANNKRSLYTKENKENESNGNGMELIDNEIYIMEVKPDTNYETVLDKREKNADSNGRVMELKDDVYSVEVKPDTDYEAGLLKKEENNDSDGNKMGLVDNNIYLKEIEQSAIQS
ncbi:unnamed protein product, partial [Owenia fusiformis]